VQLIPIGADDEMPWPRNLADFTSSDDAHASPAALFVEHGENLPGGAIAEKLAQGLLVIGNGVLRDQRHEIGGGVAGERRFGEVRVGGDKIFRPAIEVGEIAAPAAGDEDFFPMRGAWSCRHTRRPRLPASMAHISPAAPAPKTMASKVCFTGTRSAGY
jgi:hypothetical protein